MWIFLPFCGKYVRYIKKILNNLKHHLLFYYNNYWTLPQDQQQHPRHPTTDFVLIRTHQAGIVARNRCCDLNQAGLRTKYWSDRLWVKLKKYVRWVLIRTKPVVGCLRCCCCWSCGKVFINYYWWRETSQLCWWWP